MLKGHADGVLALSFSPDSFILASGSDDKTVRCGRAWVARCLTASAVQAGVLRLRATELALQVAGFLMPVWPNLVSRM